MKVNALQPASFTCTVQGDPLPAEDDVQLIYLDGNILVADGISKESSSTSGLERQVSFSVDSVNPENVYYCYLEDNAFLSFTADTYGMFNICLEYDSVTFCECHHRLIIV